MDRIIGWKYLAGMAAALVLLWALPAAAQIGGGGPGPGQRGQQQQQQRQQPPPTVTKSSPPVPEPWPRLESGALLCKSRDDLVSYQKQIGSGASTFVAQRASGCRTIGKQTGIKILDRDGPSRTQIVTNDDAKETAWTNTYLPDQEPAK